MRSLRLARLNAFLVVIFLSFCGASGHVVAAPAPGIDQALYYKDGGKEDIYLRLTKKLNYKIFALSTPPRLVVELPTSSISADLNRNRPGSSIIKAARFGQFDPAHSRLVFELSDKPLAMNHRFFIDEKTKKYFIQITLDVPENNVLPTRHEYEESESIGSVVDTRDVPSPKLKPIDAGNNIQPVSKTAKMVVVIDAGHGDQDPGTIGPGGTQEKDVTLLYARALKAELEKTGRYKAVLTRDSDRFIRLRDRVKIARDAKANLFISLHADSAPGRDTRGLSVYTVSEKASDAESAKLAERENSSDVIAGFPLNDTSEDVANILIDLAQRETKVKSGALADHLVKQLDKKVRLLPNSHRFAGFAVLKAPDIPSVLVETGFLSNSKEERMLNSADYQKRVVQGIVNGIDSYFDKTRKP